MPSTYTRPYCHLVFSMMSAILGRELAAAVVGRPSGALSDLWRSDRGLAPPANSGRPSGAEKQARQFCHGPGDMGVLPVLAKAASASYNLLRQGVTTMDQKVRVWGVIPAAGAGRRMGRPKQTLPFRSSTLAGTVTRTLLEAGVAGVVVVTRRRLVRVLDLPRDPRVRVALNDEGEMIDSIRIGLDALAGDAVRHRLPAGEPTGWKPVPHRTDGVIVVPADMPTMSAEACRSCIRAYAANPHRIVIATYCGRRGHPIIFPFSMRDMLDELHAGLNELPRRFPQRVELVVVDDPGVTRDVDTPLDYDTLQGEPADG